MRGRNGRALLWIGPLWLLSSTLFAQDRWVYRYNGPGDLWDCAYSIAVGSDGNLYAAGYSTGIGTSSDFTIVSLVNSGVERWIYRYDGSANLYDRAHSIAVGSDGNLYAAGYSYESGNVHDFTVVSLNDSGMERWVYRYDGPANHYDGAYSIVVGADGNLYAAGYSRGSGTLDDFTVVSLSDSGMERWIYRYNGPGSGSDEAGSIIMGSDGNLYVAGFSEALGTGRDFTVVSLTDSGMERWVYRYDGPGSGDDIAWTIVTGPDGNLYVAGGSYGSGTSGDFTVVSVSDSGEERWVYRYNGPASAADDAYSIVWGSDGNLYAAGYSTGTGTSGDFTIVSLVNSGVERWVYRYDGPANHYDGAYSIVVGADGNLYAAGESEGSGTGYDFTVVSVSDSGAERWVYRYDGPAGNSDCAYSIAAGSDGNLYAAGRSTGSGAEDDFTVVSLSPDVGVEESLNRSSVAGFHLSQNGPNPFHHWTVISYSLPATAEVTLTVYDITGRLVETLANDTQQPGIHQVRWNKADNPSGVYFYRLRACPERSPELAEGRSGESVEPRSRRAGEFVETRKMVGVKSNFFWKNILL